MCPSVQLTGLYPRSEDLIALTRAFDRGQAEGARTQKLFETETEQIIELQRRLRFDHFSDGAIYWQDPLRPLAKALNGVSSGSRYSRWFDTNTFYAKPSITGPVSLGEFQPSSFLKPEPGPTISNWKIVIPGPYTFTELSENKYGLDKDELILSIAKAETQLIRALSRSRVSLVQLAEPCLVYRPYREDPLTPHEVKTALNAVKLVAENSPVKVGIHTYFGDASTILEDLVKLPLDSVGFDLYSTDYERLHLQSSLQIVLGIVDSRESHVEDPQWITHTATLVSKHVDAPDFVFSPNSDLKYLPRKVADAKVEALASAARLFKGSN